MNNGTAERKCLTSARACAGEHQRGSATGGAVACIRGRIHAGPTNNANT